MEPNTKRPGLVEASREMLLHALYEAAELEHNLMCTYLYAAFSLKSAESAELRPAEAGAVERWRRETLSVAIDEMSHLAAVWNITSALGGVPRFGRTNFPIDPGYLPAGVVVKLAPFNEAVLQHFIHLERPLGSSEPDGAGFSPERIFVRGSIARLLTPMGIDYETVGEFYATLGEGLRGLVARVGESAAFCGDPALQLSEREVNLPGARRVVCLKTALAAFDAIVIQGEGSPAHTEGSHFERFCAVRRELDALMAANPEFVPSHPSAINPVLRRPPRPEGRVWIEDELSIVVVDLANAAYGLMLRLLGYAYAVPAPHPDKALTLDLAIDLMHGMAALGQYAARLRAGPSNPQCNAGMSFTNLRDAAPLSPGPGARRFFVERFAELAAAAAAIPRVGATASRADSGLAQSARVLAGLADRAAQRFDLSMPAGRSAASPSPQPASSTGGTQPARAAAGAAASAATGDAPAVADAGAGIEVAEGGALSLTFEAKRCIHARFCVTGAPTVFLANVQGPWLHPDTLDVERLAAIAQECPSGAIRYRRKDGRPNEAPPPVNLVALREAGPYALRGQLELDGVPIGYRATLCRCGASKNKPFCDGSHREAGFTATGEPPSGPTDMLPLRDGALAIAPQRDGPLQVRGNLEITSGTGRVVARLASARLCRCGGSSNKPFCDGTHARIGFRT